MSYLKIFLSSEHSRLILMIIIFVISEASAIVTLKNNAYRGITVAIGSGVKEDPLLLERIKELFERGSEYLYKATRNRAYFGKITIMIPSTWEHRSAYQVVRSKNVFKTAEFRVDLTNPRFGHRPYTVQPGDCGDPGLFTHFTPEFILQMNNQSRELFGNPERLLVHEWAHLRYGVFDEYANDNEEGTSPFYIGEDHQIHATGCTADLVGWLLSQGGQPCTLNVNGLPNPDCQYYPDLESNNNIRGSIMNLQFIDPVDSFCDNDTIPHNYAAPNKQNLKCGYRSTWEVISGHLDFANDRNLPRNITNLKPNIKLIQNQEVSNPVFILALDISLSMRGHRMQHLHRAARRFITDQVQDNSKLALITFTNQTNVAVRLTSVTKTNRRSIADKVPKKEEKYGDTAIGKALNKSLEVLGKLAQGSLIILITDGEENMEPYIQTVLPNIKKSGVIVNTIGGSASVHLEELTKQTGGRSYYLPDDSAASYLDIAFFDSLTLQAMPDKEPVQVANNHYTINPNKNLEGSVFLEREVGKNTKLIFTSMLPNTKSFDVDVTLHAPSNVKFNLEKDVESRSLTFNMNETKAGRWTYVITNNGPHVEYVTALVTTEAINKTVEPIRIHSWISGFNLTFPSYAKVFAEVKQGYKPVLNAEIVAEVDRPRNGSVKLYLKDNGLGADTNEDDGIYSAYFTNFIGDGRYGVITYVENTLDAFIVEESNVNNENVQLNIPGGIQSHIVQRLPPEVMELHSPSSEFNPEDFSVSNNTTSSKSKSKVRLLNETVERVTVGGTFQLHGYTDEDSLPPARITDLEITEVSVEDMAVALQWTSPGDDLYDGNASSVEIRYNNSTTIIRDFESGFRITTSDLLNGSLVPPPSGLQNNIKLKVSSYTAEELKGNVLFFVIQTCDEVNNCAETSNVGRAYFPSYVTHTVVHQESQISTLSGLIILVVLATTLVSIAIIVAVLKFMHWRRKVRSLQVDLLPSRKPPYTNVDKQDNSQSFEKEKNRRNELYCNPVRPHGGVTYLQSNV